MSVMLIPIALFFSFFFRVVDGDTIICFSRNKFFSRKLLYCGTAGRVCLSRCPRESLWFGHEGFDRLHEHLLHVNSNAVKAKWAGFGPHMDIKF